MVDRPKTVWVLGSGFSKSLGGPLLDELLTFRALEDTSALFPSLPERARVYNLFNNTKGRWKHAEEFMEFVDLATDPETPNLPMRTILARLIAPETVNRFRDLAAVSIAAEVSTFTASIDLRAEAWDPYVRWAKGLRGGDSVVTFNYDTVVEKLGDHREVKRVGRGTVVMPTISAPKEPHFTDDFCLIYKLHGSADWAFDSHEKTISRRALIDEFTLADHVRPLIATPGATKKRLCGELLADIWTDAMGRLREAEVIVFLGYRFPPSDSYARSQLLGAIQQNSNPYLRIHTVLGPDLNSEASFRLRMLLTEVLEARGREPKEAPVFRPGASMEGKYLYNIIQQPLYAQDFLSVASLNSLYGRGAWEESPTPVG